MCQESLASCENIIQPPSKHPNHLYHSIPPADMNGVSPKMPLNFFRLIFGISQLSQAVLVAIWSPKLEHCLHLFFSAKLYNTPAHISVLRNAHSSTDTCASARGYIYQNAEVRKRNNSRLATHVIDKRKKQMFISSWFTSPDMLPKEVLGVKAQQEWEVFQMTYRNHMNN